MSPKEVAKAVKVWNPAKRREFLGYMSKYLAEENEDFFFLKAAESSFGFWDNPEDARYDLE